MPAPLLLVDDDLATIAQVKRLLAREGYEFVLATNAADAIIAWSHHLPKLVLISPHVESDRGRVVLEELRQHPEAQLLHVLLLGETIPGFGYPVAPLPLDPETFGATVNELVTGTTNAEGWQVHVAPSSRTDDYPAVQAPPPEGEPPPGDATEPDAWRATREGVRPATKTATLFSTPDSTQIIDTTAEPTVMKTAVYGAAEAPAPEEEPPPPALSPPSAELESSLFGDLEAQVAHEVETEAMASVDANLARLPVDRELQDLEDDVRAEAARRREKRLTGTMPAVGLPTPDRAPPPSEVDGFESFDEPGVAAAAPSPPQPSPSESEDEVAARLLADAQKARALLARAEEMAQAAVSATVSGAELQQLWAEVERLESEVKDAKAAVEQGVAALQAKDAELAAKDEALAAKDADLAAAKDAERAGKDEALAAKDEALAAKDAELAGKDAALAGKDTELAEKNEALAAKDAELAARASDLEARDADLAQRGEASRAVLAAKSAELELKEGELMAKDAELADLKAKAEVVETARQEAAVAAEALAARLAQAREKGTELEAQLKSAEAQS